MKNVISGVLGALVVVVIMGIGGAARRFPVGNTAPVVCDGTASSISPLSTKSVCIFNNGSSTIFLGPAGVTAATGFPLDAGQAFCDDLADLSAMFCISGGGSEDIRFLGSR